MLGEKVSGVAEIDVVLKTELRRNRILFVQYIIVVKCVGSGQDYLSSNPDCYLHLCASHLNYCDLNFNCKMWVVNCTYFLDLF